MEYGCFVPLSGITQMQMGIRVVMSSNWVNEVSVLIIYHGIIMAAERCPWHFHN